MLFVKDLLFVDGSLATLAPDLDLFAEVAEIATYFTSRYGERIAHDIGIDPRLHPIDMNGVKGRRRRRRRRRGPHLPGPPGPAGADPPAHGGAPPPGRAPGAPGSRGQPCAT